MEQQPVTVTVTVEGRLIEVTMPGTSFRATYQTSPDVAGVWLWQDHVGDNSAAISLKEFLALAWQAAHDKARELDRI